MRTLIFVCMVPVLFMFGGCSKSNPTGGGHDNHAPNTPSNPTPANGSIVQDTSLQLAWTGGDADAGDAVKYNVYLDTTYPPTTKVTSQPQTDTSYNMSGLSRNTSYYWRVVATDGKATTQGDVWLFTTTSNHAPDKPSNPAPTNGSIDQGTSLQLSWTGGDADAGDVVEYDIYFDTTSPPVTKVSSSQTGTTYKLPGLLLNTTTYYWRVTATDGKATTQGDVWHFTTRQNHAPNIPSNPTPANGAINQNASFDLSWTGGDVDSSDTVRYDIYLGTVNPPATRVSSSQTGTRYTASYLSVNTTYYWYVVASDDKAAATGDVWHFTTKADYLATTAMRQIPGGTFLMSADTVGQTARTVNRFGDTVHQVTISAFYMDTTEVTQADYLALIGWNPSNFTGDSLRPVEQVTWYDVVLYCNKRSKRDGLDTIYTYSDKYHCRDLYQYCFSPAYIYISLVNLTIDLSKNGYRLPTEAEWEYACKAGTTTNYYWGNSIDGNYCWYPSNSNSTTHTVATKLPNAWGLYDMSGNVWEWCNDWYGSYYNSGSQIDPTGPSTGSQRSIRGGAYGNCVICSGVRSAVRSGSTPDSWSISIGFRCVRR